MEPTNYKYTIQINQRAIIENNLKIDIVDASIFDFIHFFQASPKTKKMVDNGVQYFYLHWSKIVEQIPLLGITTRQGVYKRLQNLIDAKLLEAHQDNGKGTGLMWFCLGSNYDLMFVTDSNNSYTLSTKVTQAVNESLQVDQKAVNESLPYNTISKKDNTISNTNSIAEKKIFSEQPQNENIDLDSKKNEGKEKSCAKKENVEKLPHPCDKTQTVMMGEYIEEHGDGELHLKLVDFFNKDKMSEEPKNYESEMYKEFKAYWTALIQIGKAKGQERWRNEKTFSVAGRLATWAKGYKSKQQQQKQNGNNFRVTGIQPTEIGIDKSIDEVLAERGVR